MQLLNDISPANKSRADLEDRVTKYLQEIGYFVWKPTYHDTMPDDTVKMLQTNFSLSALYIRSRADGCAVSCDHQFEFDAKSHSNGDYKDLTVEFFPLLVHCLYSKLIDCLYVCQVDGREFGFWVSRLPKIRNIIIPDVPKNKDVGPFLKKYIKDKIPMSYGRTLGSNDPVAFMEQSVIKGLPHWQDMIGNLK